MTTAEEWTVDDALALLHPEMDLVEIRSMIILFGIRPTGKRQPLGHRGQPYRTYSPTVLQRAHATVMRARVDLARIGMA